MPGLNLPPGPFADMRPYARVRKIFADWGWTLYERPNTAVIRTFLSTDEGLVGALRDTCVNLQDSGSFVAVDDHVGGRVKFRVDVIPPALSGSNSTEIKLERIEVIPPEYLPTVPKPEPAPVTINKARAEQGIPPVPEPGAEPTEPLEPCPCGCGRMQPKGQVEFMRRTQPKTDAARAVAGNFHDIQIQGVPLPREGESLVPCPCGCGGNVPTSYAVNMTASLVRREQPIPASATVGEGAEPTPRTITVTAEQHPDGVFNVVRDTCASTTKVRGDVSLFQALGQHVSRNAAAFGIDHVQFTVNPVTVPASGHPAEAQER